MATVNQHESIETALRIVESLQGLPNLGKGGVAHIVFAAMELKKLKGITPEIATYETEAVYERGVRTDPHGS